VEDMEVWRDVMCGSGGMCVHARVCACMWVDKCAERGGEY